MIVAHILRYPRPGGTLATMRSLPHIVIACGIAWGVSRVGRAAGAAARSEARTQLNGRQGETAAGPPGGEREDLDFRLVALGSLLPDLVDKTFGRRLYQDDQGWNDHTFGHTLAFNLALAGAAFKHYRRQHDTRLLSLAAGSATHLLVDPVIRVPRTLFWPLFGARFPRVNGLGRPATLVSQALAFAILIAMFGRLAATGRLGRLLMSGRL